MSELSSNICPSGFNSDFNLDKNIYNLNLSNIIYNNPKTNEVLKEVKGFSKYYISNLGNVYSLKKRWILKNAVFV